MTPEQLDLHKFELHERLCEVFEQKAMISFLLGEKKEESLLDLSA